MKSVWNVFTTDKCTHEIRLCTTDIYVLDMYVVDMYIHVCTTYELRKHMKYVEIWNMLKYEICLHDM